jgi:UDP-glucose 6-dehydrogenase
MTRQIIIILLTALFSSQVFAMSKSPDSYTPPAWTQNANAEKDAAFALAHKDLRLLAYAARSTIVPGISQNEKELLSKQCGLRVLEGFGDVVRSPAQLQKMKAMHDYAAEYNKIIAAQCQATTSPEN